MSASYQWFINTDLIKGAAIEQIKQVEVYPASSDQNKHKKQMISKLESRPYWCISRQRAWGVPIPVFYSKSSGEAIVHKEIIDHINTQIQKELNVDFWWEKTEAELIPSAILEKLNLTADDLVKGLVGYPLIQFTYFKFIRLNLFFTFQDILDIWFDSGISWSYALEEPKVADLYLEGHDQFTGWFQSSLMTSVACRGISPYR